MTERYKSKARRLSLRHSRHRHWTRCFATGSHRTRRLYRRPRLVFHGELGSLIRGASWKGVDSIGELDPDNSYPG